MNDLSTANGKQSNHRSCPSATNSGILRIIGRRGISPNQATANTGFSVPIFTDRNARRQLDRESNKVHQTDLGNLLENRKKIEEKVRSGKLNRFSTDIKQLFSMLGDYWSGRYRTIPWKSVAAVAGALIYVLNPLDLIPDMIFGFGLIDDAGVVALCLRMVASDLHRYIAWKETQ